MAEEFNSSKISHAWVFTHSNVVANDLASVK